MVFCFEARYLEGELRTSGETPEVRWVPPEQVLSMIEHPAIRESVRDILAGARQVIYRAYTTEPYRLVDSHMAH